MYMLHQQQETHHHRGHQRQFFVQFALQTEVLKENGRGMTRKEQVLGDKFVPIKEIAKRIYQSDQPGRGVQGHEADRCRADRAKACPRKFERIRRPSARSLLCGSPASCRWCAG